MHLYSVSGEGFLWEGIPAVLPTLGHSPSAPAAKLSCGGAGRERDPAVGTVAGAEELVLP